METVAPGDPDAEWAVKHPGDTDDLMEGEEEAPTRPGTPNIMLHEAHSDVDIVMGRRLTTRSPSSDALTGKPLRDRKASLPLISSGPSIGSMASNTSTAPSEAGHRQTLKELLIVSDELYEMDPAIVAEEITRLQHMMFLDIKVQFIAVLFA
jgi:hypothetical protein